MRVRQLILPALVLLSACGSGGLKPRTAEALIRPDYPAMAPVKVPRHAAAVKDSPELARFEAINAQLAQSGWFKINRKEEHATIQFEYLPAASAPATLRTTAKGFEAPAAEVAFVKVLRAEGSGRAYKVAYQVRLEKPTALFPLFQFLHPGARIGDVKERHARIDRQGKDWALMDTDEEFKPAK